MELKEYLLIIKKRLWVIVLFAVIAGIISYVINYYYLEDFYQANTTLYISRSAVEAGANLTYTDLMIGSQLIRDFQEVVTSREVIGEAASRLNIPDLTPAVISNMISANVVNDTRVLKIISQSIDPELASMVANSVSESFREKAVKIMNVESIGVIDEAIPPSAPFKPNRKLNIIIAVFLGIMAGVGLVFLIDYFDNTVKTAEDVEKHLGIPVIGTIPLIDKKYSRGIDD
jgi:capsular polysaccharide biosynthesis protein